MNLPDTPSGKAGPTGIERSTGRGSSETGKPGEMGITKNGA